MDIATIEIFSVTEAKPSDDSDVLVFTMDDNELGVPLPALYFSDRGFIPSELVSEEFEWTEDSRFTHWCYVNFNLKQQPAYE